MACVVKATKPSKKNGGKTFLAFRLYWDGRESWEGTQLVDTPENRRLLDAHAVIISREMEQGTFDYCRHFPNGNRASEFKPKKPEQATPETVRGYFETWLPRQQSRVRPHRLADYRSQFGRHILPAVVGGRPFGDIYLSELRTKHLQELQIQLKAKGLKSNSVNGIIGGSLRAMIKDARCNEAIALNLFDRDLFSGLECSDVEKDIDPFEEEERELILEGFKHERFRYKDRKTSRDIVGHYYPFVFHQFWTGCRPGEACALKRSAVDLKRGYEKIQKSRVERNEGGTKTRKGNREVRLHGNLVRVLNEHLRFQLDPDAYVFVTPEGTPIDEANFYKRHWLPMLRKLRIRPRPFYNTRHSYVSLMFSTGARSAFIARQTGDRIHTLETHYAKYMPSADTGIDQVEASIHNSETRARAEIFSGRTEIISVGAGK